MTYDTAQITPNSAEYQRIHRWVVKELGKAKVCSNDPSHQSTRFDWSNISRTYQRDITDWRQLCRRCHKAYDKVTEDGKRRISAANKINSLGNTNHNKPVFQIYPHGSWLKWPSSKEAAKATGLKQTNIANAVNGWTQTAGGFQWRRVGG